LRLDGELYRTRWTDRVVLVDDDERRLTEWMIRHLRVTWCEYATPRDVEQAIIQSLRPRLTSSTRLALRASSSRKRVGAITRALAPARQPDTREEASLAYESVGVSMLRTSARYSAADVDKQNALSLTGSPLGSARNTGFWSQIWSRVQSGAAIEEPSLGGHLDERLCQGSVHRRANCVDQFPNPVRDHRVS